MSHMIDKTMDANRPLIICDVDEVILHFILHLEDFLLQNGARLKAASYSLNGNISDIKTGSNLSKSSIKHLINKIFDELSNYQKPVDNAIECLVSLQMTCDIILLTNFPDHLADQRRKRLAQCGLVAPLLTNEGCKAPTIQQLTEARNGPTFFLDDSPDHIKNALALPKPPICIHFIADSRFASLASKHPVKNSAFICRDWPLVQNYIEKMNALSLSHHAI
ncbi:MAG: hypothetical protein OIF56_03990 [Cohaesibacter sp.]|nr:hypothetical protein [Cohaesibacter sp.]MCV6603043.1 hypothetical protein [Cohaesibacter sp.]